MEHPRQCILLLLSALLHYFKLQLRRLFISVSFLQRCDLKCSCWRYQEGINNFFSSVIIWCEILFFFSRNFLSVLELLSVTILNHLNVPVLCIKCSTTFIAVTEWEDVGTFLSSFVYTVLVTLRAVLKCWVSVLAPRNVMISTSRHSVPVIFLTEQSLKLGL